MPRLLIDQLDVVTNTDYIEITVCQFLVSVSHASYIATSMTRQ